MAVVETVDNRPRAEGAVLRAVEQFVVHMPEISRVELRRAFHSATNFWAGDARELWWRWTTETLDSVGVRAQAVDCTVAEAIELAREGAILLCAPDHDESGVHPVVIDGRSQRSISIRKEGQRRNVRLKQVRSLLKSGGGTGMIRCVVIDPDQKHLVKSMGPAKVKPLQRVWQLLRPESSDIWLVVVFAFVVGLLTLATPIAVESLVNTVAFGRFLQPVIVLAILLMSFLTFSAAVIGLQTYVVEIIERRLFARVAADLSYRLPRTSQNKLKGHDVPETVNRFLDIALTQKVTTSLLLDGVGLLLSTFIGMVVLAFYHPFLLGFDVVLLASITFIVFVLGRGGVKSAIDESKKKYAAAAWFEELARCPVAFHTSAGRELAADRANTIIAAYLSARREHFSVLMRQIIFALFLQAASSTLLLGLGGWLVISGELTLGQLVAAELIVAVIVGGFAKLGKHLASFYDLLASVDKLGVLFDLETEKPSGLISPPGHMHSLQLEDVVIGGRSRSIILSPGETLAILEENQMSGEQLLHAIYGFDDLHEGHILIDGLSPDDFRPDTLRERVALVDDIEIFSGTIEENVDLNRFQISPAAVREITTELELADDILHLADGYDTKLNSTGHPLNRNQLQLLMLARALVGRPHILLINRALDSLPDDDLERALSCLLAPKRQLVTVVTTGRRDIAACLNSVWSLQDTPGSH
ncbi:ABC transporter ATP-binding protein [Rubinisphaera margarita]|uniref:ABC transporter ATP-binding protein n=1 Tax=Rubinisphaera margarita TaxID=2909586 RepID=UPI001EE8B145|nr:ABC transporter ATP-binding protein [Rubinisphaera margarita]MCG6156577.1 ABC transporter ATP-binding protein/permease [Rubinisphaera margarita]